MSDLRFSLITRSLAKRLKKADVPNEIIMSMVSQKSEMLAVLVGAIHLLDMDIYNHVPWKHKGWLFGRTDENERRVFHGLNARAARLDHALFDDCIFTDCDFRGCSMNFISADSAEFDACKFTAASMRNANLSAASFWSCEFHLTDLNGADLSFTTRQKSPFIECDLDGILSVGAKEE